MQFPFLHNAAVPTESDHVEHGCGFMREMLSSLADGTAKGIVRWYAEQHVAGCPNCSAALSGLKELRVRLRAFGLPSIKDEETGITELKAPTLHLLSPERRAAIAAAWESIEEE